MPAPRINHTHYGSTLLSHWIFQLSRVYVNNLLQEQDFCRNTMQRLKNHVRDRKEIFADNNVNSLLFPFHAYE